MTTKSPNTKYRLLITLKTSPNERFFSWSEMGKPRLPTGVNGRKDLILKKCGFSLSSAQLVLANPLQQKTQQEENKVIENRNSDKQTPKDKKEKQKSMTKNKRKSYKTSFV